MTTVADIRATGALSGFPDRELDVLLGATQRRSFAPGELLCAEGAPGASCYVLLRGDVDVVCGRPPNERWLTTLHPGAIVGQVALVDRAPRTATVRALFPVDALEFARDTFEALLRSNSPMALRFQMHIAVASARQLREASTQLTSLLEAQPARQAGKPGTPQQRREDALRYLQAAAKSLDVPVEALDEVESVPRPRSR